MKNWQFSTREPSIFEQKVILGLLIEIGILVVMGSHCYEFAGNFYSQRRGGPIGLAVTAWIASITMKCFDNLWTSLLLANKVENLAYIRYVDDSRQFLRGLRKGVRWKNGCFSFDKSWEIEDIDQNLPDDARNAKILSEAMNTIMPFLNFTAESPSDYSDNKLPTLD